MQVFGGKSIFLGVDVTVNLNPMVRFPPHAHAWLFFTRNHVGTSYSSTKLSSTTTTTATTVSDKGLVYCLFFFVFLLHLYLSHITPCTISRNNSDSLQSQDSNIWVLSLSRGTPSILSRHTQLRDSLEL
jgi:hypothetical protein